MRLERITAIDRKWEASTFLSSVGLLYVASVWAPAGGPEARKSSSPIPLGYLGRKLRKTNKYARY
jgi:hypothetical protein